MTDLNAKGILITRPLEQCDFLVNEITRLRGNPYVFPTLAIKPSSNIHAFNTAINSLDRMDIAVFMSSNAVKWASNKIKARWPVLPRGLKFAAIGNATKAALEQQGWPVAIMPCEPFNSESLLQLPDFINVANQNIIIFSGNGGRKLLQETLKTRYATVLTTEVYERYCPDLNITELLDRWQNQQIHIVLSTSNESLQNLYHALCHEGLSHLHRTPLLVISERMANFAQKLGYPEPIIVAKNASDDAIMQALVTWSTGENR